MSLTQTPNLKPFIDRGVSMLKANIKLFPPAAVQPPINGLNLVTNVLAQEPPIGQSANDSVMPMIYVAYSKNPIGQVINIGRDSRDVAGAKYYSLEFYNIIMIREITKEASMETCQNIAQIVADVYQNNMRMVNPVDTDDFLCAKNSVVQIPFVPRSSNPTIQAINVVVRPRVPISLREAT